MKCPLLCMFPITMRKEEREIEQECLEEECAWWRKEYPACCIYSIERALWALAAELGTIQARMPKQF